MSNLKRFLILLFLFTLFLIVSTFSYANTISNNLTNNLFRLHIVANSNYDEDQVIKYIIRDNILQYIDENFNGPETIGDLTLFIENNIEEIKNISTRHSIF